ncbi:large subunit GTPase 1 homolog [Nasonia vitripennis]|uniref:Large subunit GTPase 1 homolog n=1 Tax=Nasonia vitripennis TaxID=7425 RepID=A0A7M7Q685_NASVI|nr:large subunit GTPase 1 homolog [Nasonia vitripennis]XP_031780418.1 large subunit GTPase 1 homolog [Nasonia vitripennis]XP_031780419.1 large subunit GTPase 1 homolog [Nasonia vitripennis]
MSKKNAKQGIGRALIKDRFGPRKNHKRDGEDFLHTVDMQDGYDWGRLNLQSVTEESSFQEFLATAELADMDFQAEKLNIKFISTKNNIDLPSKEEQEGILKLHEENKSLLKIPRRPKWDKSTTSHELQTKEKEEFLEWRKRLSILQEKENILMTPYEKNLEFWRQLWRVIERSDVIVQIVDARNPLLFRCEDLEQYVKEVDPNKLNMILINKADFLTPEQRVIWAEYFDKINVKVAFFSATLEAEKEKDDTIPEEEEQQAAEEEEDQNTEPESDQESAYSSDALKEDSDQKKDDDSIVNTETKAEIPASDQSSDNNKSTAAVLTKTENPEAEKSLNRNSEENNEVDKNAETNTENPELVKNLDDISLNHNKLNSSNLLSRDELIELFRTTRPAKTCKNNITTIGLVGYPNVGKSSTINALLTHKKVSVSTTPGKTKHFQTIFLDSDLMLCDCPGLVMPSFVSTKAEMVLNGILPVNQLRDHVAPITVLGSLIPRHILEEKYGIMIPLPEVGEDPDRTPTSEEILNAHGYNRGFMTQNGQPDNARSARYILKDFICGKLLFCKAPPDYNQDEFHKFPVTEKKPHTSTNVPLNKPVTRKTDDLDKKFFQNPAVGVHKKGKKLILNSTSSESASIMGSQTSLCSVDKPWKAQNKHGNKKKREKLRRVYAHLDKH